MLKFQNHMFYVLKIEPNTEWIDELIKTFLVTLSFHKQIVYADFE